MLFFDTCVLTKIPYASSVWEVLTAISHAGVQSFGLPRIVLHELLAQRARELQAANDKALSAWEGRLRLEHRGEQFGLPALTSDEHLLGEWELLYTRDCSVMEYPTGVAEEALRREAYRVPPVKVSGAGARDAAIWLTVLNRAKTHPQEEVILVSSNEKDFGSKGELLGYLADEAVEAGVTITYLTSLDAVLERFSTKNVLDTEDPDLMQFLSTRESLRAITTFAAAQIPSWGFQAHRLVPGATTLSEAPWYYFDAWIDWQTVRVLSAGPVTRYSIGDKTFHALTAHVGICGPAWLSERNEPALAAFALDVRLLVSESGITPLSSALPVPLTEEEEQQWLPELLPYLAAARSLASTPPSLEDLLQRMVSTAPTARYTPIDTNNQPPSDR